MIDLHTHTNESDGTYSPAELVNGAVAAGLEALAITDHDTFAGYDQAVGEANAAGLDLVCGIELSARAESLRRHTVHLLGYFLHTPPAQEFRQWLQEVLAERRDRNRRLIASLQSMGLDIELAEVERLGRTLAGRPHFAKILVQKGYARTTDDAFRRYIGESAPSFVERQAPWAEEAIQRVAAAGGLAVLAHPIRLGLRDEDAEEAVIRGLCDAGLKGLEVYHSDHAAGDAERYAGIAKRLGLAMTGGSDFHGTIKPHITLGSGFRGNLAVPRSILEKLREA